MKALDRFVKRYRSHSISKALRVWSAVFTIGDDEIAAMLRDGRL